MRHQTPHSQSPVDEGAEAVPGHSFGGGLRPMSQRNGSALQIRRRGDINDIMDTTENDAPGEANEGCEAQSDDQLDEVLRLFEALDGTVEKTTDGSFDTGMNELWICVLEMQAEAWESNYARLGSAEWIEKAVECREHALRLTRDGDESRFYRLGLLGTALYQKFERVGEIADINRAIQSLSQAMQLMPDGHSCRLDVQNNIGNAYLCRFKRLGELADVAKAIKCLTQVTQLTPDSDPDKPSQLSNLGSSYRCQFERLGELSDVGKAIECLTQAVQLTPDGHPHKPERLNNLGSSYMNRFNRLGELADLAKGIECHAQAVQLTPDGHPNKPSMLSNLGASNICRFERLGELADVTKAIECHTQAVRLTPDGHPGKPSQFHNLGRSYDGRFDRLGDLADVAKAIECLTQAVQLTPDGHPDKPSRLETLGNSYLGRFERLGELADVAKAIECQTQAVQLTPDGHQGRPSGLGNLGNSYMRRFERLGELADLARAIECQTKAAQLTPDGHPNKPSILSNLGASNICRFERLGELVDVTKAIECHTQAVQLTPDGHPSKSSGLSNLGSSYMRRFERLGELADVAEGIECLTQAAQLTPDGHPHEPICLNNLGSAYLVRFERLGELADVAKAIECLIKAVKFLPDGHPGKPTWLNNLGNSYMRRFERLGEPQDLQHANSSFQHGAQLILTSPDPQHACSLNWADTSSLLGLSPQPAYERSMELLPHLISLGITINDRYSILSKVGGLATEAVAWAISVQSYELAVEWLEEGRSIVWNQILQLRTPFDNLFDVDPQLAQHLKSIASQLESAGSRQVLQDYSIDSLPDLEQVAERHRRLATEWEKGLEQARRLPGFHHFLKPRKFAELKLAATDGPVVLINTHSSRRDALVLFPQCDDISHVTLPDLSVTKADESLLQQHLQPLPRNRGDRDRGFGRVRNTPNPGDPLKAVLQALWHMVVKPILDSLACMREQPIDDLPHITWCATGSLAFAPLHAAGPFDGSSPPACNLAISSYAPSLSALLASNAHASHLEAGILAVGQEYTKGHCPLPGTAHELAAIKEQFKTRPFQQLDGGLATVETVLNAMDEHSWVHLACHASQHSVDPIQSAFHLHDGNLTLEAITKRQFKNKGLAFLSACQTATGDGNLPDEALHLAAGMLMAGYPSVIATMWSISDADGPEVAGRVYAELLKDGKQDYRGAARALHKAVAGLRQKIGEESFKRWVPFTHIGV